MIAIEDARLFDEVQARTRDLTESLQQQTATADVLKVISSSPGELEPVFQALLENAVHLCEAEFGMLFLPEENEFRAVGSRTCHSRIGVSGEKHIVPTRDPSEQARHNETAGAGRGILVDQSYIERHPGIVAVAEEGGARTLLQVPMLKENELVGTMGIIVKKSAPSVISRLHWCRILRRRP